LSFRKICIGIALLIIPASARCVDFRSFQRGDEEISVSLGRGGNHRIPESAKDRFQFDSARLRYAWFTSPSVQGMLDLDYTWTSDGSWGQSLSGTVGVRRFVWRRNGEGLSVGAHFGLSRMRQPSSELGTRTNFVEQLGVSYHYSVDDDNALSVEYRFSHVSNGGIRLPNVGINASLISVGYSWFK